MADNVNKAYTDDDNDNPQKEPGSVGPPEPGYPGVQQPGYPGPPKPGYPGVQQPGYPRPPQPGYSGVQQQGYPGPPQPGYPAVQSGYPVVQMQPEAGHHAMGIQILPDRPNNYFALAVFTTVCCCWCCGAMAIKNSREVDVAYERGDYERARISSEEAKKWVICSFIGGIVGIVVIAVLLFIRIQTNSF